MSQPTTLAIDIGGSGIKGMLLDPTGQPISDRQRIPTPQPPTPDAVLGVIAQLGETLGECDRISVGFPGVVTQGIVRTAVNLSPTWQDFDLAKATTDTLQRPTRVANDADIQGYGVISGKGVELVVTLGTGFGSALFTQGKLVPNLEIAHHVFRKRKTYEDCLGRRALKKKGNKTWNRNLQRAIASLKHSFNYETLYIGGGETKRISFELPDYAKVVPNKAGILGGIALWND
ncbi:MAG: ROK family protein [Cyanobacteria bacterium P01_F01_bin.42]